MQSTKTLLNNGVVLHTFKISIPNVKPKTFYHISDSHLNCYDSLSKKSSVASAKKAAADWLDVRKYVAQEYNEMFNDISLSAEEYFANSIKTVQNADALILSGDICDFVSGANMRFLEKQLKKVKAKILSVCGNHESPQHIKDGYIFSSTKNPINVIEFDDLVLVGIDNSAKKVTPTQIAQFKKVLELNKSVILVMHTPIKTDDTAEIFAKVGDYYALNHKDHDQPTKEFIELLQQNDTQIELVLAGHLHFQTVGHITRNLCQLTASQNITGNLFKYEII